MISLRIYNFLLFYDLFFQLDKLSWSVNHITSHPQEVSRFQLLIIVIIFFHSRYLLHFFELFQSAKHVFPRRKICFITNKKILIAFILRSFYHILTHYSWLLNLIWNGILFSLIFYLRNSGWLCLICIFNNFLLSLASIHNFLSFLDPFRFLLF